MDVCLTFLIIWVKGKAQMFNFSNSNIEIQNNIYWLVMLIELGCPDFVHPIASAYLYCKQLISLSLHNTAYGVHMQCVYEWKKSIL